MFAIFKDKAFYTRFFLITLPVMFQTVISFFVNFIDNIMVGGVSNAAVSAVYATNQMTFFIFVSTYGLLSGASIYVQQFFGAKDIHHLRQAVRYKLWIGLSVVLILIPLLFILGPVLVQFYAREDANQQAILAEAAVYLPYIVISFLPYIIGVAYASTYREIGKTSIPMKIGIVALLSNAVFNYLFIYVFSLGVAGAGLATLLARIIEMILLLIVTHRTHEPFAMRLWKDRILESKLVKLITLKTLPMVLNEVLWSSGVILQSLSFAQRANVLSALSIQATTTEIFGIIFAGLATGIGVMVGSTLGEGKIEEAKKIASQLIWTGVWISLLLGFIFFNLAPFIPQLWTEVPQDQKELATNLIRIFTVFLVTFSVANSTYHTLRAGGKTSQTLMLDAGIMWVLTIPMAWALALYTSWPLLLVYPLIQLIDVVKMMFGLYLIKRGDWARNLTIDVSENRAITTISN
jgi:putative MATE family efflux protein